VRQSLRRRPIERLSLGPLAPSASLEGYDPGVSYDLQRSVFVPETQATIALRGGVVHESAPVLHKPESIDRSGCGCRVGIESGGVGVLREVARSVDIGVGVEQGVLDIFGGRATRGGPRANHCTLERSEGEGRAAAAEESVFVRAVVRDASLRAKRARREGAIKILTSARSRGLLQEYTTCNRHIENALSIWLLGDAMA